MGHALSAARSLTPAQVIVVTGHGAAAVTQEVARLEPEASTILQAEQLGTGHALRQALPLLEGFEGRVVVLYGDTPFIRDDTLAALANHGSDLVVLGFEAADPGRYGRLVVGDQGLDRIVEWKDADDATRQISLCNSGVMALDAALLRRLIVQLGNDNASGEYYLTDLVALARAEGRRADVVVCDESETLGINTRVELADAEAAFQARARRRVMEDGVTLTDPASTFLSLDTVIGADTVIGPHVVFGPGVTVEAGAEILPFCHLENCHVSAGAKVGPFAGLPFGDGARGSAMTGNPAGQGTMPELQMNKETG